MCNIEQNTEIYNIFCLFSISISFRQIELPHCSRPATAVANKGIMRAHKGVLRGFANFNQALPYYVRRPKAVFTEKSKGENELLSVDKPGLKANKYETYMSTLFGENLDFDSL